MLAARLGLGPGVTSQELSDSLRNHLATGSAWRATRKGLLRGSPFSLDRLDSIYAAYRLPPHWPSDNPQRCIIWK
jgi:hypothetical protein